MHAPKSNLRKIILITLTLTLQLVLNSSHGNAQSNYEFFFKSTNNYADVLVTEVRSIDRFVIYNQNNEKEIIKMIGLKAPKTPELKREEREYDQYGFPIKSEADPLTPIEEKAFLFAREILENQHVRLEFDSSKKDDQNNTLAYVFLLEENTFVNLELLRLGYADLQIRPPNTKYKTELRKAYQEARREKRGLQGQ